MNSKDSKAPSAGAGAQDKGRKTDGDEGHKSE